MSPDKIKALRAHLETSQENFAAIVGSTTVSVNRWEKGKAKPSPIYVRELKRIAEAHGFKI
jgi:DNA-binding transcriptional regulator YiaG